MFYVDTLGLTVHERTPFALVVDGGGGRNCASPSGSRRLTPATPSGWRTADLSATVDELRAKGVDFLRYQGMDQDDHAAWTAPDGTRVACSTIRTATCSRSTSRRAEPVGFVDAAGARLHYEERGAGNRWCCCTATVRTSGTSRRRCPSSPSATGCSRSTRVRTASPPAATGPSISHACPTTWKRCSTPSVSRARTSSGTATAGTPRSPWRCATRAGCVR